MFYHQLTLLLKRPPEEPITLQSFNCPAHKCQLGFTFVLHSSKQTAERAASETQKCDFFHQTSRDLSKTIQI